jgi:hypothetical protein
MRRKSGKTLPQSKGKMAGANLMLGAISRTPKEPRLIFVCGCKAQRRTLVLPFCQIEEDAGRNFVSGNENGSVVEDLLLLEENGLAGRIFGEKYSGGRERHGIVEGAVDFDERI